MEKKNTPLITLLKPGAIIPNNEAHAQEIGDSLPIEHVLSWFTKRENKKGSKNRVLVLKSDTGSGKSTLFPAKLFESKFNEEDKRGIGVTQPKIINAINIVKDQLCGSPYYPFLELGENIGWQTSVDKKLPSYGLTYMTLGTLTQQFKTMTDEELMIKYKYIIVDEVHEASLEQTLLLVRLKNFIFRNEDNENMPFVVLTSATLEEDKILKYFSLTKDNFIYVTGFAYDLDEKWDLMPNSVPNYINAACQVTINIHMKGMKDHIDNRDVLIFMPSPLEIEKVKKNLSIFNTELAGKGKEVFTILVIDRPAIISKNEDYNSLNKHAGQLKVKISGKVYKPFRKVIIATSVAETGITIDTLKYVVDPGYHRGPEYHPWLDASGIMTKPSPKSRLAQRKGRCNRKSEGVYIPLFPKYINDKLQSKQFADIKVSDIGEIFTGLCLEQIKSDNKLDFDFDVLDSIPNDSVWAYAEKCYVLGFINYDNDYVYKAPVEEDNADLMDKTLECVYDAGDRESKKRGSRLGLTRLGAISTWLSMIKPESIKMLLAGYAWNINILDLASIAAYLVTRPGDWIAKPDDTDKKKDKPKHNNNDNKHNKQKGNHGRFKNTGKSKLSDVAMMSPIKRVDGSGGFNQGEVNWSAIYKLALDYNELDIDKEYGYNTLKYLIADNFINGLLIFLATKARLSELDNYLEYDANIKLFCKEMNMNYDTLMSFLRTRDDLINTLIFYGLDINYGQSLDHILKEDFVNYLIRLKHCIFEGYKNNLLVYDEAQNKYVNKYGMPINFVQIFEDNLIAREDRKLGGVKLKDKPKYVLASDFAIKQDRKNEGMYVLRTSFVSYMDSFVNIDLNINLF